MKKKNRRKTWIKKQITFWYINFMINRMWKFIAKKKGNHDIEEVLVKRLSTHDESKENLESNAWYHNTPTCIPRTVWNSIIQLHSTCSQWYKESVKYSLKITWICNDNESRFHPIIRCDCFPLLANSYIHWCISHRLKAGGYPVHPSQHPVITDQHRIMALFLFYITPFIIKFGTAPIHKEMQNEHLNQTIAAISKSIESIIPLQTQQYTHHAIALIYLVAFECRQNRKRILVLKDLFIEEKRRRQ